MKRETRVFLSTCHNEYCIGIVVRGEGIDGIISGLGCRSLCHNLRRSGYIGETRYAHGDCTCGLKSPPGWMPVWNNYLLAVRSGWEWLKHYKPLLKHD